MYIANPSGMPALARRLRRPSKPGSDVEPPVPRLLIKDAEKILRRYGGDTPRRLLLPGYSASAFKNTVDEVARLRQVGAPDLVLAYSIKTNPSSGLLGLARDCGMWAEAISQDEVTHAVDHGFASEHIVLNGPGKWWPSPIKIPRYGAIFCDSIEELRALSKGMTRGEVRAETLGIRFCPATVGSRFGISMHQPDVFREVVKILQQWPRGQDVGFHFHIASSMVGIKTWHSLAENFLAAVALLCDRLRGRTVSLSFGGGWHPDDWTDFIQGKFRQLILTCQRQLPMVRRILIEPGKALSQRSMCLVTRVLEVRRSRYDTELVVDGSIAELPDLRSHCHRVVSLTASGRLAVWRPGSDRILGRLCMEFDILSQAVRIPRNIRKGDFVAYLDAGAYDASMAYSFGRGTRGVT